MDALSILLCAVLVAAFFQPERPRAIAAAIYAGAIITHEILLSDVIGSLYYVSAGLFDMATVWLLSRIAHPCSTVLALQRVAIISIILNCFGWAIWFAYLPPTLYNYAYLGLYLWSLIILIKRPWSDVGIYTHNWSASIIRSFSASSRVSPQTNGEA